VTHPKNNFAVQQTIYDRKNVICNIYKAKKNYEHINLTLKTRKQSKSSNKNTFIEIMTQHSN